MQKKIVIIGCGRIELRHAEKIIHVANVKVVYDIVHTKTDEMVAFTKLHLIIHLKMCLEQC